MPKLALIAHNIRSTHNVGSILRTADGLGVDHVYLTGYTPYPIVSADSRLPHEARKVEAAIHKTALGAEHSVAWSQHSSIESVVSELKTKSTSIIAIEQHANSIELQEFLKAYPLSDTALIVGNEVTGLEESVLNLASDVVKIEMHGQKESFNVAVAAAIALYQFKVKLSS